MEKVKQKMLKLFMAVARDLQALLHGLIHHPNTEQHLCSAEIELELIG